MSRRDRGYGFRFAGETPRPGMTSKLRQPRPEAAPLVDDPAAPQRRPIGRHVDGDYREAEPALCLAGEVRHGEIGAGLHDGVDALRGECLEPVAHVLLGGMADLHLARPLEAVDGANAPAALLEEPRHMGI